MKQTNNALKFLLAQYRAIFKHAYIKGLASAVLLTAGLALAGTAQAATEITADTDIPTQSGAGAVFDGEISSGKFYLNSGGNYVHDLTINGGSLNSNDTTNKPLMVNGTLTVNAGGELNLKTDGSSGNYGYGVWGWNGTSDTSGAEGNTSNGALKVLGGTVNAEAARIER